MIIGGERRSGKTIRLIQLAHERQAYIVCADLKRVEHVARMAEELGLDIPFPIPAAEAPLRGYMNEVLVDDAEDVLHALLGKPVHAMTVTMEARPTEESFLQDLGYKKMGKDLQAITARQNGYWRPDK